MPTTNICDTIAGGAHDENLDAIIEAVKDRLKVLGQRTVAQLLPGQEVRFSNMIRPKYLAGKTATVAKVNRQSVVVDCPHDPSYGRYNGAIGVRCPFELIEGLAE